MKALVWHDEQLGAKFDEIDIPAEYADKAAELRAALVEMAVEEDDAAMEAYLEGGKEPAYRGSAEADPQGHQRISISCR